MVESASLTMLKQAGAKAKAVAQELEKTPETPAAIAPQTVSIDVDTMSAEELDALVTDQEIATPAEWSGWDADGKREWLKAQFSEDGPGAQGDEGSATASASSDAPSNQQVPKSEVKVYADGEVVTTGAPGVDTPSAEAAAQEALAKAKPKKAAKKQGKGAALAISDATTGEIVPPDMLQDLVHEVENLKEAEAQSLVGQLLEQTEVSYFKIGGILSLIQANGWFKPYATFREFVESKHGIGYRTALNWIEIYVSLSNSGISWEKVSTLGWTKLAVIAPVVTNENVDEWVGLAQEQNTLTLIETVKKSKQKDKSGEIADGSAKTVTTMAFKVHEDQKATIEAALDKAKKASGTQVATVALEFLCMDFLGGKTLAERLKTVGVENACKALEQAFPDMDFNVAFKEETQAA